MNSSTEKCKFKWQCNASVSPYSGYWLTAWNLARIKGNGALILCWWEWNLPQPLGKTLEISVKGKHMPSVGARNCSFRELNNHRSSIINSSTLGIILVSIYMWEDK
jgi:hypothetical protein